MEHIKLGERVKVNGKNVNGKVAFIGETHFSDGLWYGVMLDEPIGRHDGVVEGKRYFKCPRSHGIFIRASHIEKLNQENTNDKVSASVPSKATYPNYSNSGHKLKSEKMLPYKNGENMHMNEIENAEKKLPEEFQESTIHLNYSKPCYKFKFEKTALTRKNVENMHKTEKGKIPEVQESPKDGELQKIKDEIEELKVKLKNTEDTLNDTLEKYTKMIDENQHLREELDNKKKRIRIQRDHMKLLKMRQCNHVKEIGSPKTSSKKPNPGLQKEGGDQTNAITHVEGPTLSDEEFDLETTKSLPCTERVVELEEQIRIMKQGLIQLREFLKCHSPASFVAVLEACPNGKEGQNIGSTTDKLTKGNPAHNNLILGLERAKTTSALKEYYNMLCEMTRSIHITKERGNPISGDRNLSVEKNYADENNIQQFRQQVSDQIASLVVAENCIEVPRTSKESETSHKHHILDNGYIQNVFQRDSKQHAGRPLNITLQVKRKTERHFTNHKPPIKVVDSVNKLKQLMPAAQNEHRTSSSSLTQQQSVVIGDTSDSASNSSLLKSDLNTEFSLTSLEQSPVLPFKSSGGGDAVNAPRGKTPQGRMQFSTRKQQNSGKIPKNSANKNGMSQHLKK